eukprot:1065439-Prorocentrum_lima.AAC.1
MTSSLVGSEMCIRDRGSKKPGGARGFGKSTPALQRAWLRASTAPRGEWAVSYTHLTLPTICSV